MLMLSAPIGICIYVTCSPIEIEVSLWFVACHTGYWHTDHFLLAAMQHLKEKKMCCE